MIDIAPVTKGSEKQIAWATTIKQAAFADHDAILSTDLTSSARPARFTLNNVPDKQVRMIQGYRDPQQSKFAADFAAADAELAANDDARFWIDHRNDSIQYLAKDIVLARQEEAK